ncbi:SYVM2 protein, partial [Pseudoatta argentina]
IMKYILFDHPFLHVNFCYRTLRCCTSTATAAELCNYKRLADFPAIFKPKDVENGWYDTWQRNKYFASSRTTRRTSNSTQEEKETKESFSMVLPPPNITGILHLGHALTVIIQDVLARWLAKIFLSTAHAHAYRHRMKGHPVLWIPGLDHAGIATQAIVERTLQHTRNITRYDMGRDEFTQLIWQWKAEKAAIIKQQLKALGATLDWDREYFTIDENHSTAVTETFVRLHERNLLYRAKDLVNWSPALRSTISDIEVEDFIVNGKTRAVKITPAHDRLDYNIAKRHDLPVICVIDEGGNMTDACKEFKVVPRFITRKRLMDQLSVRGLVKGVEDNHRMTLPLCSRTHDVIEYLPKEQWFLRCTAMAKRAYEAVANDELKIYPNEDGIYEKMWYNWLENHKYRDWCVSRQLWWGHRIPAYSIIHGNGKDNDNDIFSDSNNTTSWIIARSEEEAHSLAQEKYGNTVNLRQDPDVLDTWFSSTVVPFATLGWPENTEDMARHYPLTLMETGHDILMFWVARMVMLSLELTQRLPFKEVLLHGVLCDGNGKKMSKSSGNVISPENIINGCTFEELNEQARRSHAAGILSAEELRRTLRVNTKTYSMGIPDCGADALRLSLCARNIKNHTISFDVDDCRTSKYFCNKIWQASKYVLLMTKEDQQRHENVEKESLNDLDRWILSRLSWMVEIVNNAFAERNFHKAITAIRQFLYYEFCDFYVEGTKFGFRSGNSAGHSNTLAKCLEVSLRILAPVTPYLSDDLYVRLAKKGLPGFLSVASLLETSYPMPYEFKHLRDIRLEERICELVDVTNAIRSCMANVSKKSNPEVNILVNNVRDYNFYRENVNLIKGASKIWNVPIHLTESANDSNFNRMMTRDNNSDGDGVCTVQYMHTNDCSLLITAMDTSVLEQVKKNIAKNKSKSMC